MDRLAVHDQHFCPLCDRAFIEGEAVLRCDGCRLLHHPGCWVGNDGCGTVAPHRSNAVAEAFGARTPISNSETTIRPGAVIGSGSPPPRPSSPRAVIGEAFDDEPAIGEPVIGAVPPRRRPPAPYVVDEREASRRRYRPPGDSPLSKQLPSLYGNHRWLGYWYIPAAAAVAILVAGAVIFAAEKIFGEDGGSGGRPPAAVVTTAEASPAANSTATRAASQPAGSATATVTGTASRGAGGKFQIGEAVIVTGAGQGECLNVRTAPGRSNDSIVCVPDNTELTVRGGPENAGDLRWWRVQTLQGEGWAAEDFLARKP